jgi:hypothetical protein
MLMKLKKKHGVRSRKQARKTRKTGLLPATEGHRERFDQLLDDAARPTKTRVK